MSFSISEPSPVVGASQARVISVLFTERTLMLVILLATSASVVTTMSAYSGFDFS